MGKGFALWLLAAALAATAERAHARWSAADCGTNLQQVNQVIAKKFPQMGTEFTRAYVGQWVYAGYDPMVIASDRPFRAMGYELVICPRADKSFLVYWKSDRSLAGVLKLSGRNQVTIYQTNYGDITLKRAS